MSKYTPTEVLELELTLESDWMLLIRPVCRFIHENLLLNKNWLNIEIEKKPVKKAEHII